MPHIKILVSMKISAAELSAVYTSCVALNSNREQGMTTNSIDVLCQATPVTNKCLAVDDNAYAVSKNDRNSGECMIHKFYNK